MIAIKRFGFEKFNFEPTADSKEIEFFGFEYLRIISSILIEDYDLLAVFYLKYDSSYSVNFYDLELNKQNEQQVIKIPSSSNINGENLFYKAIHLYDQYIAFICLLNYNYFSFQVLELNNYTIYDNKSYYEDNSIRFYLTSALNDFLKLDNDRLVFISTSNTQKLYIILIF